MKKIAKMSTFQDYRFHRWKYYDRYFDIKLCLLYYIIIIIIITCYAPRLPIVRAGFAWPEPNKRQETYRIKYPNSILLRTHTLQWFRRVPQVKSAPPCAAIISARPDVAMTKFSCLSTVPAFCVYRTRIVLQGARDVGSALLKNAN